MKRRSRATAALVSAVGYVRGASEPSRTQQIAIKAAGKRLGLELVDLVREHEPGVGEARPGLARLLQAIDGGEASCLIVGGLTQLSDDVAELAALIDRLERGGIRLIALDVGLDTSTPSGRLAIAHQPVPDQPWRAPVEQPGVMEPLEVVEEAEVALPPEVVEEPEVPEAPDVVQEPEVAPPLVAAPEPQAQAVRTLGYASVPASAEAGSQDLDDQRRTIEGGCELHGLELVEFVGDREPKDGKALDRPGLSHAIERIAHGDASCLVVSGLERLSRSVAELGTLVRWLERNDVRLVAIDLGLDTATPGGRVTARTLASVGDWERDRLSERTRTGLAAARAKRHAASGSSEAEWAALRKRIAAMRADGMTLQAIADLLNAEGVPTQRGGAKWRPSSVHTAAGYKRRSRSKSMGDLPVVKPPGGTRTTSPDDRERPSGR